MRKRNKHISVWMTEQEYTHLKQQAARSGLGMDPFIRNLVQGIRICEKPPEQYVDMLQELSAIGITSIRLRIGRTARGMLHTRKSMKQPFV